MRQPNNAWKPLGPAEAEDLFKTLARPSGTAFSAEEAALVVDICRRMRYLPLAVKLTRWRIR